MRRPSEVARLVQNVVVINFFDSLDAMKQFAGPDYQVAEFEPEVRLLSRIEPVANHYEVRVTQPPYSRWLCPVQIFVDIPDIPIHPILQRDRRSKMRQPCRRMVKKLVSVTTLSKNSLLCAL